MEEYIFKYNTFNKYLIYYFTKGMGGIGDYLKFFTYLIDFCIKNNIKLFLYIDHPLDKYIRLKYDIMYINLNYIHNYENINNNCELSNLIDNKYYIIKPFALYSIDNIVHNICNNWILKNIFIFSDEIIINSITNNYISIHLRLGDKYLETDKNFVICKEDTREYNENKLYDFIENHKHKIIYFFCDNKNFKNKIKNKYSYINILNNDIGHTSLLNTSDEQIKNSIIEFYLLSQSQEIYMASRSGFSLLASRFNDILYNYI